MAREVVTHIQPPSASSCVQRNAVGIQRRGVKEKGRGRKRKTKTCDANLKSAARRCNARPGLGTGAGNVEIWAAQAPRGIV